MMETRGHKRFLFFKLVLCPLIFIGSASSIMAAPPVEEVFAKANQMYQKGEFGQAAQAYEEIAEQGIVSSSLYYNLGNAYVKTGEIGPAVLAYARALRENPRDPEAQANYQYAKGLLADRIEDSPLNAILGQVSPSQWLSWRENVWAFCVLYWVGTLFGILAVVLRRRWRSGLTVALSVSVIALSLGLSLFFRSRLWSDPEAIVMAREVEVRYGPVMGESTAFTLHEGSQVKVLRAKGEWNQINFAKGKVGWVPSNTLEII
jgi:tetratricopeptide (TPR) repeat protein